MPHPMEVGWSRGIAITPHDTTNIFAAGDMREVVEAIYVGGAGALVVVLDDDSTLTFAAALAGTIIPIRAKRVNTTGTVATNLVGLYAV